METVDPKTLLKYVNQWIALTPDRTHIVASGQSVTEVETKLRTLEAQDYVLKYVPPADRALSPLCHN